jgi:Gluconate 2-dehydrogenase subunit 3
MEMDWLTRRSLLDLAVRLAASGAGAELLSKWSLAAGQHGHGASAAERFEDYQPRFFSREDFEALQAFSEILIPTDDTPGAREAHCAHFMDFLLEAFAEHEPEMARQWRNALAALKAAGFHAADRNGREALVEAMAKPERYAGARHPAYFAYRLIKRENTFAFYTAREGMIGALNYKGNSYNAVFPACNHPEHHVL